MKTDKTVEKYPLAQIYAHLAATIPQSRTLIEHVGYDYGEAVTKTTIVQPHCDCKDGEEPAVAGFFRLTVVDHRGWCADCGTMAVWMPAIERPRGGCEVTMPNGDCVWYPSLKRAAATLPLTADQLRRLAINGTTHPTGYAVRRL